ncbi:MAG: hypothetical protein F9K45_12045, partial [Melioribacteraceae bacterium]
MQYLLEITASTIVGGMILLLIMRMNTTLLESATTISIEKSVQSNITSLIDELDYYFKQIGYRVKDEQKIITADKNEISFLSDIDNDGDIDTVSYYLSKKKILKETENPNDKLLYRVINSSPEETSNLGVTAFELAYYNGAGALTNDENEIKYIKYTIEVESFFPINGEYKGAYAERIVRPNNLR